MALSKRERVIRTFELQEPDMCPVYFLGFERSATSYQNLLAKEHFKEFYIKGKTTKDNWLKSITQYRFFNSDIASIDPFLKVKPLFRRFDMEELKRTNKLVESIKEPFINITRIQDLKPGTFYFNPISGRLWEVKQHEKTGLPYPWYVKACYETEEIIREVWDLYGKPLDFISDEINWKPRVWEKYCDVLSPYLYPMANIWGSAMHESLLEGIGFGRAAYFMRKKPEFVHEYMNEQTKYNVEVVKRLADAGVDCVMYWDDLGQKGRSLLSIKNFKEFVLPYYRKIFQTCKKRGIFVSQHSDGYIDEFAPLLADAGLDCLQSLEPASGVNLAELKESLKDKMSFMGGMDSSRILNFGTPKDVEEDVKKIISIAAPGGGYFAGPSHQILDAPIENVLALRSSIEKYKKYPLDIN